MRSRCTCAGSSTVSLTVLSLGSGPSFSLLISCAPSALIGHKDQIAVDNHPHREARPDGQGRLHIQLTAHQCLSGLVDGVLSTGAERFDPGVVAVEHQFARDTQQRRNRGRLEKIAPMIVDIVLEPRIARAVCSRLMQIVVSRLERTSLSETIESPEKVAADA